MSDPLAHLLDEIDAAAAGMPQGPYWVGVHDRRIPEPDNHFVHSESDLVALEMTAPHAAYFAALDPQVVQALVAVVRAAAHLDHCDDVLTGMSMADESAYDTAQQEHMYAVTRVVNSAMDIRAIAAERIGTGE